MYQNEMLHNFVLAVPLANGWTTEACNIEIQFFYACFHLISFTNVMLSQLSRKLQKYVNSNIANFVYFF